MTAMSVATDSTVPPAMPAGWRIADDALRAAYPRAPWSWLLETGSLTHRLQAVCGDAFSLRVIGERTFPLPAAEARLLDQAPGGDARVREVHLSCMDTPCIYAMSLLPLATLAGGGSYLDGLGDRPLGDALFADPGLERGAIEVVCLGDGDTFRARTGAAPGAEVWGRRSVFRTGGSPLLVSEFFLPGVAACGG